MNEKKLTFIDLFAGCGGLSEGFLQTGKYEALAHIEWEMPMVKTLRNRLVRRWGHQPDDAFKKVIHFDIQKTKALIGGSWDLATSNLYSKTNHCLIKNGGLKELIGKRKVDLIIGGPPCQAYSIAGRAQDKNSMKDDYRNYLFESFVKMVDEFRPKVFIFENVPGLLSACPGDTPVTQRIYRAFKKIGYEIRSPEFQKNSVYTATEFGVPQKRNRVIIIGVNSDTKLDLESLYTEINLLKQNLNPRTVKDAIFHLPKFVPLKLAIKQDGGNVSHRSVGGPKITDHEPRFHNKRDVGIFTKWIKDGMNTRTSEEKILFYNKLLGKSSNHAKYRNLTWNKPSPTIVAHLYKDGLMFIHPDIEQARSITVKEAALLQSFPDDYEFLASQGFCFKMIGNAVPPEMSRNIAEAIYTGLGKK